jgi:hypothetical protein
MSSYNLYDGTVTYFINGLNTLADILKKAEDHCKENNIPEKELMEASLAPDMKPLPFQIQTASNTSKNTLVRLISSEAVPMDDNESSFAELQERIARTVAILKKAKKEDFDFDANVEIKVPMGKMGEIPFSKKGYVQSFALPNFYFHVVTAYAILRMKGVAIGKGDFLRPGMQPPTASSSQ